MIDKRLKYKDQKLTKAQQKKIKPFNQGGGPNYLGKQKTVTVPKKWLSSPDHVVAELAYITPREQKILLDANLYGSLKGKPNRGPDGIMSLQGDMGSVGGGNSGNSGDGNTGRERGANTNRSQTTTTTNNKSSNDGGYRGPSELGVTTRAVNPVAISPVDRSAVSQFSTFGINTRNQNLQGASAFAPKVSKKKGWWDYTKQVLGIASFLNPASTIAKVGQVVTAYDKAKQISALAKNLGITNTDVLDSLKDNFKDGNFGGFTNTTSSINPNNRIGGDNQLPITGAPEGIMKIKKTTPTENVIGSLPNASRQNQQSMTFSPSYTRSNVANESEKGIANLKGMGESFADVFKTDTNISVDGEGSSALLKEYAMLLKQMEQGLLQTEGRERLNILKSRLGLAQGGITNVNMNKGQLGEVLHG